MVYFVGERWQWVSLCVDAAFLYMFRYWYQSKIKNAEEVENAVDYNLDDELLETLKTNPQKCLSYACVEGKVHPLGKTLRSQFSPEEEGVLQKLLYIEHKSKRSNGYWSDVKKIIKDQVQQQPFSLQGEGRLPVLIEVNEPLTADFLQESLTTTYDHYVPTSDTLLSRGLDRIFGEVSKGYQETEKMLGVGVKLLGIGKVALTGGRIVLEPPDNPSQHYILTTQSKKQIISELKGDAKTIKVFMWVVGMFGAGLVGYLLYRNFKSIMEQLKIDRMYREIREQREQRRPQSNSGGVGSNDDDAGTRADDDLNNCCIICMSNPREVVLLECGHICLCGDCTRILPEPRKCPMCRSTVSRFLPVYRS